MMQLPAQSGAGCSVTMLMQLPAAALTFAGFVHVLVHGAGGAAVLGAAEAAGLEQGRGKLAHAALVVEFATGADGAALHVLARQLAGKARVLSWGQKE